MQRVCSLVMWAQQNLTVARQGAGAQLDLPAPLWQGIKEGSSSKGPGAPHPCLPHPQCRSLVWLSLEWPSGFGTATERRFSGSRTNMPYRFQSSMARSGRKVMLKPKTRKERPMA